jgi:mRNA interferase MazF
MTGDAPSVVRQRDIWWARLGEPVGSLAGFERPVIVLQGDRLNATRITSYFCVPLTSTTRAGAILWNMAIPAAGTGLDRDSVAQVSLALALHYSQFVERIGEISERQLRQLFDKLDLVLGRAGG